MGFAAKVAQPNWIAFTLYKY